MDGDLIPPPAYVEQEFDQKVSTALQISLSAPQLPLGGEEQWEEWNDAAFHAAAHALANHDSTGNSHSSQSSGVGSSTIFHLPEKTADGARSPGLPAVEPLRIRKKARSPSSQPKPRPSWIAETQTDTQSSASGSIRHEIPPDEDEEDHSSPPPPFTAVPPSVDGRPVIVMSYQPSGDSRSPSPLNSPIQTQLEIHAHVHDSVSLSRPPSRPLPVQPQPYVEQLHASNPAAYRSHRPTRQSLPTTPTLPHPRNAGQRPSTTYSPRLLQSSSIPRMDFNPYVAYGHDGGMPELPPTRHSTYSFDPNGFYNSAVAAHLSPVKTPARQSRLLSIPDPSHLVSSHQLANYDGPTTTGSQPARVLTPSRHVEPWPSSTPADIPAMNSYPQPPLGARYSQDPQYRPG